MRQRLGRRGALGRIAADRAAAGGARPIRINLSESDRPVAFSLPLASKQLRDVTTFHLNSPASIKGMLDRFGGWLRPMAVQLCLASYIAEHNLDLNTGVFHVIAKGRLQAVVSRNGVGVLPIADPAEVIDANWAHRPPFADEIPRHFLRIGFPQLMWQYAMRTDRDVLPARFRTGLIYWRAPPQLPNRLLGDTPPDHGARTLARPGDLPAIWASARGCRTRNWRAASAPFMWWAPSRPTGDGPRAPPMPRAGAQKESVLASLRESFASTSSSLRDRLDEGPGFFADATAPAPFNPNLR